MEKSQILATWIIVGLLLLILLLGIISQIDGPEIRSAASRHKHKIGSLVIGNSVLSRGVPIKIKVEIDDEIQVSDANVILLRSTDKLVNVGQVSAEQLNSGEIILSLPCDNYDLKHPDNVRLVLIDNTEGVIAQSDKLFVTEAGRECFYQQ